MRSLGLTSIATLTLACGGGSMPSTPTVLPSAVPPSRSALSVTVTPNPLVPTLTDDPWFAYRVDFIIRVTEAGGLPCNLNRVVWSYKFASGGNVILRMEYNPSNITAWAGTNFVAANGSLAMGPLRFVYPYQRQIVITVLAEAIDARGNTVTATTDVNILSHGGSTEAALP